MKDITGSIVPSEYTSLEPLLNSWVSTVKNYCELHKQFELIENCWWHNERASISILAGAAWRIPPSEDQWVAIEEFATDKRGLINGSQNDGDSRYGRCDMYVTNSETSYAIEAKQVWQSIGDRSAGEVNVKTGLDAAWKDAGSLHSYEADWRMAVTFIVPYIPLGEVSSEGMIDLDKTQEKVKAWLDRMGSFERVKGKPTAYAYNFPYECAEYSNDQNGRLFPGIVVVLERRMRGN
ncbi:hypothetical protein LG331_04630 [Vreelandella aquamarina]|uniref:hypothetical protein n=1 Tax=Vreelandella aquamarina TaxID=77097 RepID=UPI00384F4052